MLAVEIKNGVKSYRERKQDNQNVLDGIDMRVRFGEIYGLIGASATGKTTLLRCIVGLSKLKQGSITVLGETPSKKKLGPQLGYMPQELALSDKFTIRETVVYFGRIFGMKVEKIERKLDEILGHFEMLDKRDSFIVDCSGGQRRVVSFILTVVHEPQLLVFDEPTVGLDVMLRQKMWQFLKECSLTSNSAIIITTHYTEEAEQADTIGYLRNGKILAENTPAKITSHFQAENLQGALFEMCERIDRDPANTLNSELFRDKSSVEDSIFMPKKSVSKMLRFKAMLARNILMICRSKVSLWSIFCSYIFSLLLYRLATINDTSEFSIGVVTSETMDYDSCLSGNYSVSNPCDASCFFMKTMLENITKKSHIGSFDKAHLRARENQIDTIYDFPGSQAIEIYLYKHNAVYRTYMLIKIYKSYEKFLRNFKLDCPGVAKKVHRPLSMELLYDSENVVLHFLPSMIILLIYFFSGSQACAFFIADRLDHVWNRNIVAGVSSFEIYLSHLAVNLMIVLVQCVETILLAKFVFDFESSGNDWALFSVLYLQLLTAISFGFLLAVVCNSHNVFMVSMNLIFMLTSFLNGLVYPTESQHRYLKYFTKYLPFTKPTVALRSIFSKGSKFFDYPVVLGNLNSIIWIAIFTLAIFVVLRVRK